MGAKQWESTSYSWWCGRWYARLERARGWDHSRLSPGLQSDPASRFSVCSSYTRVTHVVSRDVCLTARATRITSKTSILDSCSRHHSQTDRVPSKFCIVVGLAFRQSRRSVRFFADEIMPTVHTCAIDVCTSHEGNKHRKKEGPREHSLSATPENDQRPVVCNEREE